MEATGLFVTTGAVLQVGCGMPVFDLCAMCRSVSGIVPGIIARGICLVCTDTVSVCALCSAGVDSRGGYILDGCGIHIPLHTYRVRSSVLLSWVAWCVLYINSRRCVCILI